MVVGSRARGASPHDRSQSGAIAPRDRRTTSQQCRVESAGYLSRRDCRLRHTRVGYDRGLHSQLDPRILPFPLEDPT